MRLIDADALLKKRAPAKKYDGEMWVVGQGYIMDAPSVAVPEWVSVKERMPEPDKEVLVCTQSKNGSRNVDKGYVLGGRWVHRGTAEVTHWMPLPQPPKEDTP